MAEMTKSRLVENLIAAIPYPKQMSNFELDREEDAIAFTWRGTTYRVTTGMEVAEIQGGCRAGSDKAILLRRLIRMQDGTHVADMADMADEQ